ncbi:hypothetical protein [Mesorhizobium sp. WSM3859]|uniref:hypothetical protein n=1 Tax=Mesorhizobium sp. WSM3859 TaxID=2029402 RepID=UPI000BB0970A|nr:hypothetical protein [Mesorhizobium sp. WSM3859]PBC09226.1 hypothetical protein CK230_17235 [Mesorhizobium sp. WSM3859]
MVKITTELEKLLAMPGPVSIVAGIAVLRAIGVDEPDGDLQATIGTFAAERGRAIRFDRGADHGEPNSPKSRAKDTPQAL